MRGFVLVFILFGALWQFGYYEKNNVSFIDDTVARAPTRRLANSLTDSDVEDCPYMQVEKCLGGGAYGFTILASCSRSEHGARYKRAIKFGKWWAWESWKQGKKRSDDDELDLHWDVGAKFWDAEKSFLETVQRKEEEGFHRNINRLMGVRYTDLNTLKDLPSKCIQPEALTSIVEQIGWNGTVPGLILESGDEDFFRYVQMQDKKKKDGEKVFSSPKHLMSHNIKVTQNLFDVVIGAASGMRELHRIDIIHRDLYVPGKNMLVKYDSQGTTVMVHDLGCSRRCLKAADRGSAAKAIEMYQFGNILYMLCTRRGVYAQPGDQGRVTNAQLKCEPGDNKDNLERIVASHELNHPQSNYVFEGMVCSEPDKFAALLDFCWSHALTYDTTHPEVIDFTSHWNYVIASLEGLKKLTDNSFYDY
eukprot:Rmarinus@m.17812